MNSGADSPPEPEPSTQQAVIDSMAQDWFLLMTSGEPSEKDRADFHRWLNAYPQHRRAYNELRELWADIDGLHDAFAAPSPIENTFADEPQVISTHTTSPSEAIGSKKSTENPHPQNLWGATQRPKRQFSVKNTVWSGTIAACFALLMINAPNITTRWTSDHHTAVGEQTRIELPDGSIAWLNTDTAIDVRYSENRREIVLKKGEAQFTVRNNSARPFVVSANKGRSTALGTVYTVRKHHDAAQVTVTEGSVEVVSPATVATKTIAHAFAQGRVVLKRGEQTRYTTGAPPTLAEKADTATELAWRRGFIAIRNQPLDDALAEIDRYHPGRIVLLADEEKLRKVTARLAINSVDNGLDALAATQGLKVTRLTSYLVLVR